MNIVGPNGDEVPIRIERDALEWKVYCTLTETGKIQRLLFY
jgi:hypothetical protein